MIVYLKKNNKTQILNIDDDTLLIVNAHERALSQNCDNREIVMRNNFLITFTNCKIEIDGEVFENNKVEFAKKYHYPVKMLNQSYKEDILFKEIKIKNVQNLKEIEELKYHKNVSYGISVTIAICLLILMAVLIICVKRKNVEVKIINKLNKERFNANAGEIMLIEKPTSKH